MDLLADFLLRKNIKYCNNVIIYNMFLVWRDVRKCSNIPFVFSVWSPLALNPDLLAQIRSIDEVDFPGLSDLAEQILTFPIKMFSNIYKFVALQNLF